MKRSTIEKGANAFFTGTKIAFKFVKKTIIPKLESRLSSSTKNDAIITIYLRMFLWIHSLTVIEEFKDFQTVVSGARSIYELLLDLKLLAKDKIEKGVDKFYAFDDIEKFRVAKQMVSFSENHPEMELDIKAHKELVSKVDEEKRIKRLKIEYWGKKKNRGRISHWSDLSMKQRAERFGKEDELLYYRVYSIMSWSIHAGPVGHIKINESVAILMFARHHDLAQSMFIEATLIIAQELRLDKVIPNFHVKIGELKRVPARVVLKDRENLKDLWEDIKD